MKIAHFKSIMATLSGLAAGGLMAFAAVAVENPATVAGDQNSGAEIYKQCSGCHGGALDDGRFGPALRSPGFAAKWGGRRAELLTFVTTAMPPGNAGSLSRAAYAAVVDYIAGANGGLPASAGGGTLKTEDEARIGPRAAPSRVFRDALYNQAVAAHQRRLDRLTPVTQSALRSPPVGDWLNWRRTQDGAGFSPLAQIDRKTVRTLALKWSWALPVGANEITPIVHDGVMFVNSLGEVQALDAADGTLLWRYRREVGPEYQGPFSSMHRSFAIFGGALYLSTADRHVIALDAKSGKLVWDTEVVPATLPDVVLSAGAFVADGVVIQGVSAGPACIGGCYVVGLDSQTGKQLWRFNTVARPGEPGGDLWNGVPAHERTGGGAWVAGSYDPDLDLYYFGVGQTYGVSGLLTPGKDGKVGANDAPYNDSTIALEPRTGKMIWYHQHLPGDVWDLDEVFERTLVTLPVDGRDRRLVLATGKMGILDALDRRDGRYVFSKDFGLNNLVTSIDPVTGRRAIDPARLPVPNKPVFVCPSPEGSRNWMATAYDPTSRILYVPLQANTCMYLTWLKPDPPTAAYGKNDLGWRLDQAPGSDGKFGRIAAVDMNTRKTLWEVNDRAPPSSSLLATAGGIVFTGSFDRYFRALDALSGEVLWKTRLDAAPNATPVTYTADGRQYVAITTGTGGPHAADTDELMQETTPAAPTTTIMVFGLEGDAPSP